MKFQLLEQLMTEQWKTILEAPKYEVSSLGAVRRKRDGRISTSIVNKVLRILLH